jgi:hypothetical protein
MPAAKHVVVVLHREPAHPRTAQGLRAAVGYLTANLRLTLVLGGPAEALLSPGGAPTPALPGLHRHLATLRALGHPVVLASTTDLCALVAAADAVVTW